MWKKKNNDDERLIRVSRNMLIVFYLFLMNVIIPIQYLIYLVFQQKTQSSEFHLK